MINFIVMILFFKAFEVVDYVDYNDFEIGFFKLNTTNYIKSICLLRLLLASAFPSRLKLLLYHA